VLHAMFSPSLNHALWALVGVSLLHIVEEYSLGFLPWFRQAMPRLAPAMTPRWALVINVLFVGWLIVVAAWTALPVWTRLSGAAIVLVNALLHVVFTVRLCRYSPGLVTAMLLYVPIGVICYRAAILVNAIRPADILLSVALGLLLHASTVVSLRMRVARMDGQIKRA